MSSSSATIAGIYRYPVKGLSPEPLQRVALGVGQTLPADRRYAIGDVRLKVVKTITRCAAINVDPDTAARDLEIPSVLMRRLGRNECGLFAEVIKGGTIGIGDAVAVNGR